MTRTVQALAALLVVALCAGCAGMGVLSQKLDQGLTEQEVRARIGSPESVSIETCGSSTPVPWSCKKYKYEGLDGLLIVYFAQGRDGTWRVDSWSKL
jgi:hypothetical protein